MVCTYLVFICPKEMLTHIGILLIIFIVQSELHEDMYNLFSYQNHFVGPRKTVFYYRATTLMAVRYHNYKAHFVTRSGWDLEPPEVMD